LFRLSIKIIRPLLLIVDHFVKSPLIVMPDPGSSPGRALISLPRHVVSRGHPKPIEFTGFWLPPE